MNSLRGVLQKILNSNAALKTGVQEARIVELWPETVGPMIAKHAQAVFMKGKTVFIEVGSPIWRQELFTNKAVALKKYNQIAEKNLGTPANGPWIEDLFFLNPGSNPVAPKPRW